MTAKRRKVAVLISGNGSNLQALIDAAHKESFPAQIAVVISNKPDAYGLTRAADAGIPTEVVKHGDYESREAYDDALHALLKKYKTDYVCLAGFMRLLSTPFVEKWEGKMINIHPSLLPAFKGLDVHRQVLEMGVRFTGCTVHFVVPEMDSGPIIVQAAVPVKKGDDEESLQQRVHQAEHKIYPLALRWLTAGQLKIDGQRVEVNENVISPETSINPDFKIFVVQ